MDAKIVTRVATAEDAPMLAHLNFACNGVRVAPDILARRLADPQRVEQALVAEIDGRIAVGGEDDGSSGLVELGGVLPIGQRRLPECRCVETAYCQVRGHQRTAQEAGCCYDYPICRILVLPLQSHAG